MERDYDSEYEAGLPLTISRHLFEFSPCTYLTNGPNSYLLRMVQYMQQYGCWELP